jgi:capsule polysaccharide export protein KpsC/LpsZ
VKNKETLMEEAAAIQDIRKEIEVIETNAVKLQEEALMDDLNVGKKRWKDILRITQDDYENLKSQIYHKPKWQLDLAKDWYRYAEVIKELSSLQDWISTVSLEKDYDKVSQKTSEAHFERIQLEKIFQETYGQEFIDRWGQWYKKINNLS